MRQALLLLALLLCVCHSSSVTAHAAAPGSAAGPAPSRVSYTVAVTGAPPRHYRVSVRAEGVTTPTVSFALPAWSPGWYVLTSAQKNISNVSAAAPSATRPLAVTPENARTWRVQTNGAKAVTLSYDLKVGSEGNFGFFEPYLDEDNGFVPGPSALMYVVGGKEAPCSVTYKVPAGWQIASGNDPTDRIDTFTAPDYDTLADHPADLGAFRRFDRTIRGVPFSVVLVGGEDVEIDRWLNGVWKISEAGLQMMEGDAPPAPAQFSRYLYHVHAQRRANGYMAGLEHRNSTVLSVPLPALRQGSISSLTLAAHEFLHAWNVKRIRPEVLGPFDYSQPVRTADLWWLEGVTDYHAPRLVVEAGLRGRDYWLGYMSDQINELQNNPSHKQVTLEEASRKVWEGDESEGYKGLSYYNKGLVVGFLLDVEMRRRTNNRVGLSDLLKALLAGVRARGGKGYPEGEIERVASRLTGQDMKPFFDRALRSTEELPYHDSLTAAGLLLDEQKTTTPFLGIEWNFGASGSGSATVGGVVPDGPASRAGIRQGDVITAVDGLSADNLFGAFFGQKEPGQAVVLTVRSARNEPSRTVPVTLGRRETATYQLRAAERPTADQAAILAALTGSDRSGKPSVARGEGSSGR